MSEKTPLVSIILPTFNRADLVLESIHSVLGQTYKNFELIVIDDGSVDNTRELLSPLVEEGLLTYAYQENLGLPAARNHGIRLANGSLISFLDSDDLYLPEKLEKQVAYFDKHPDAQVLQCWFTKFSEESADLGVRDTSWFEGKIYPEILTQWSVLMAVASVMLRSGVIEKVGPFNESLRWGEDLDLWRRVARHFPFHMIPESLVRIRAHDSSMSSDKREGARGFAVVLEQAFQDDESLSPEFKRRAWARMYTNVAHNLLGQGPREQMKLVRKYSLKALAREPLSLGAMIAYPASLLPFPLRMWLIERLRRLRYPATR